MFLANELSVVCNSYDPLCQNSEQWTGKGNPRKLGDIFFSVQVHTSFLNHAETVSLTLGGH